jgi:hypothetical protein
MKKFLFAISALIALACAGQYAMTAGAAAYPAALGGTGTSQIPASGTIPIGTGAGTYTPALITPGTDVIITNASGSITIAVKNSDFLPSSTVYVATVNGQSGALTITSSTLGTLTLQSVLNSLLATGLATYSTTTNSGTISVSSSSLNLKSASQYSVTDFLPSSTVYVATVNGQSGAVTIAIPATTTINGTQATVFRIIGDGTTVTSTVSGATTTFSIINTGNWAGTWQGLTSSTFYLATNPSGFISGNQTITLKATGDATGTASGATSITHNLTITGLQGSALPSLATGSLVYLNGAWSLFNPFIFVGTAGDISSTVSGATSTLDLANVISAGTCTLCNLTYDAKGRLTVAANGSGGGASSTSVYGGFGVTVFPNPIVTTGTVALNTSTVYSLFSASNPITYNASTGAIGWTNSNNYITLGSLTGDAPITYNTGTGHIGFTNPGYITTSTGLGIANFTTSSVSQWVNDAHYVTSTGLGSYNVTSANPYISISTTTTSAALTFSTSSFGSNAFNSTVYGTSNLATSSPASGIAYFVNGNTISGTSTYVMSFNGATGTVTFSAPATTTVNGTQAALFYLVGTSGDISSTVSGSTTTFDLPTVISGSSCTNCNLTYDAKGRITVAANGTAGGGGTTTINGTTAAVFYIKGDGSTITSTVSGATTTFSIINPGWLTVATQTSINGNAAYNFFHIGSGNITTTVSGATTTFSITGIIPSANGGTNTTTALGSAAFRPLTDFLASTTVVNTPSTTIPTTYVSTWNGLSGAVTFSAPATTTINGTQSPTFYIVGTGGDVSSTVSGATTTFDLPTVVGAGSCTNCNATFDAKGRVTTFSNGSGGTGSGVPSTTPWTAGYIPVVSSSLAIANSPIYVASTTNNIGVGTTTSQHTIVATNASGNSQFSVDVSTSSPQYYLQIENSSTANVFSISSTSQSTFAGNVTTPTINEPVATSTATTASTAVNWALSSIQAVQLQTSTALSFSGCTNGQKPTLYLYQDGTGSRTATWPSTGSCQVSWLNGEGAPTLPTTINTGFPVSFQCANTSFVTSTIVCRGSYVSSTPSMYFSL